MKFFGGAGFERKKNQKNIKKVLVEIKKVLPLRPLK
jgi:hypothetical protein